MSAVGYAVDREHWGTMSLFVQMGNIYSEVGRSLNAKRQNNVQDRDYAVARALDLFDATVDPLIKRKSVRAKEVLRAKDQFLHAVYDEKSTPSDMASIDRYFLQYAIAARLSR